jgi:hypothetical protein
MLLLTEILHSHMFNLSFYGAIMKIKMSKCNELVSSNEKKLHDLQRNCLEHFGKSDESYVQTVCHLYALADYNPDLKKCLGKILEDKMTGPIEN